VWLEVYFVKITTILGFCTLTISMNSDSMTQISFAVMGCHVYPQPPGENIALEVLNCPA
jgi:hypothetical protein